MNAELRTRDGELVLSFTMPPFMLTPEVAVWGERVFVLKEPFNTGHPERNIYYEACAWSVDASKALSGYKCVSCGIYVPMGEMHFCKDFPKPEEGNK